MSARRFAPPAELAFGVTIFPLIGALEGAFLALLWEGTRRVWPDAVGLLAVWAVSLWLEWYNVDGLGDTADAMFQRRKAEDALRIFKDARIGVLAALMLMTACVARLLLLVVLPVEAVRGAVIAAPALALWARALGLFRARPAYPGTVTIPLTAAFRTPWMLASGAITLGIAATMLGPWRGAGAFALATLISRVVQRFGHARLNGIVGDLLGFAHQLAWVGAVLVASARR